MWWFVVVVVVTLLYLASRKPRGYPPGPLRLPFVGYIPYFEKHLPHKHLYRLSSTYGPVVGLFIGMQPTVVVNGWEAVKEALLNDDLNGRPENFFSKFLYGSRLGIKFVEGNVWKEQRRFALHQFRNFGFGKKSQEPVVHDEAKALMQDIQETMGSLKISDMIGVSNINIVWAMMGGTRFERSNARLWELVRRTSIVFRAGDISGGVVQSYPFLRHILPKNHSFHVVDSGSKLIRDFIKEAVDEHKEELDPNNPKDFIDAYLIEIEKQKNTPDSTFTEQQLLVECVEFFFAGTETGSALVAFGILLMVLHPEIMEKVQKELDEVVGRSRLPSVEDRSKLVYTDATFNEVFRFRASAPFAIPHKAIKDTTLQGCRIPAETTLIVNLYSVMVEPEYWGDPETFRPERFINPDGSARKDERLINFGKGHRICLGESFAKMMSFVLFTTLLQNFTFSLDPAVPVTSTEGSVGFVLAPPDFRVFAKPRM